MVAPVSVAVLAGGKSRRMGQDKAFLELNGTPLILHVIRAVVWITDELLVVAGDRPVEEIASLGCRVVPDITPGLGTLGGIYTAIATSKADHTLVLGCDMPLLSPALMAYLIARPRTYDALVPSLQVDCDDGKGPVELLQPLHAIYSKGSLPLLKEQIEHGQHRVIDAVQRLRVEVVPEDELRRFDPELRSFLNVNTPEALARAKSLLGGQTGVADR